MHVAVALMLALLLVQDAPPAAPADADGSTAAAPAAQVEAVGAGHESFGVLAPGAAVRLPLTVEAAGAVTMRLESLEFDPVLTVVDGQQRELVRDEDGGPGDGAWLVLDAQPYVTYSLVVGAQDGGGGRYHLRVLDGSVEPPELSDAEAAVALHADFAEHELARGNARVAATLYYRIGSGLVGALELEAAAPPLRRALEIAGSASPEDAARLATLVTASRAYLGKCERVVGDPAMARELLEAAWNGREVVADPGFDCMLLENLGELERAAGNRTEALARFDAWLQTASSAGLTTFEAIAQSRRGVVLDELGELEAADAAFGRALGQLASVDDPYYRSQLLLDAGRHLSARGRDADAAGVLEQAAALPTTWDVTCLALTTLGRVQAVRGRYGDADRCLERAAAIVQEHAATRMQLELWSSMADLSFALGDHSRCRALLDQAFAHPAAQDDAAVQIELWTSLGQLEERAGDASAADAAYARAQSWIEKLDRPELAWVVPHDRGRLAHAAGRLEEALAYKRAALELAERAADDSARATCLNAVAYTQAALGALDEAHELADEARRLWEASGQVELLGGGALHTLAVIALGRHQPAEAAALLASADGLMDRADVSGLRRMQAAGVRSVYSEWSEVAQDLVAMRIADAAAGGDGGVVPATGAVRVDEASDAIADGFAAAGRWKARALYESLPTLHDEGDASDALRTALGAERALVEYAAGAERLYAYVLSRDGLVRMDLGPLDGLDDEVDAFLAGMTDRDHLAGPDEVAQLGSALYRRLLAPVLDAVAAPPEGLVVVPTARLARLPFEALVIPDAAAPTTPASFAEVTFVADRHQVTYGPSTPVLARLQALGPRRTPGRALVMGDPWYASEAAPDVASSSSTAPLAAASVPREPRTTSPPRYERLLATRAEVVEIAEALLLGDPDRGEEVVTGLADLAVLKHERSGVLRTRRFDLYLGRDASAAALHGDLREYEVLHIAAHGEVDAKDPLRSGLVLSYDGAVHDHLTLLDILDLQLDANLVVLSACETARGRILEGEGVQSMAYAFLHAGGRAVIASLWSVDDDATRDTMASFYEAVLLRDRGDAEALRDAKVLRQLKQSVRHHGSARGPAPGDPLRATPERLLGHPYFWAPFIYVGALP